MSDNKNQSKKIQNTTLSKEDLDNKIMNVDNGSGSVDSSKGSILKAARKAKGLSLEVVHEATKIPLDALRAIEEGYTVRTLTPFYFRGFLKIYAKYLNVDISDVVDNYEKVEALKIEESKVEEFDISVWMSKYFNAERKRQIVSVIGILLFLFVLFKIINFFVNWRPAKTEKNVVLEVKDVEDAEKKGKDKILSEKSISLQKESVKEVKKAKKQKEIKKVDKTIKPKAKSASKKSSSKTTKTAGADSTKKVKKNVTLTARAKKNSWIQVKVDGVVVFQSTLRLGAVETWIADERIEISGKNIYQLDFEVNGKMFGSLGRKDRRAKRLVVTKDGLSVTK